MEVLAFSGRPSAGRVLYGSPPDCIRILSACCSTAPSWPCPLSEQSPAFRLKRNTHGLPQKMSKQGFLGSEIPTFDSSTTVYLHIRLSVWVCMSHSMLVAVGGQPGGVNSLLPRGVSGGGRLRPSGLAVSGLTHRALSPALRCLGFIFSFGAPHLMQTDSPSFYRAELFSTLYAHCLFYILLRRGRLG